MLSEITKILLESYLPAPSAPDLSLSPFLCLAVFFINVCSTLRLSVVAVCLIESQLRQARTHTHTAHTHTRTHIDSWRFLQFASDCRWQVLYSIKRKQKKKETQRKRENEKRKGAK